MPRDPEGKRVPKGVVVAELQQHDAGTGQLDFRFDGE